MAILTPITAGKKCGLSASQIRVMIRNGLIKAEKIGSCYVINEKDIKQLKRRRRPRLVKKELS